MKKHLFFREVCNIAIPVTLQSMLQSSFSMVDQIMIGQLGSVSIAGIGLAGKFSSIFSVLIAAVGAVAGIMIAQYLGKKDEKEVSRSFYLNLAVALGFAVFFTFLCVISPGGIMSIYTKENATGNMAARYLRMIAATYLPMAGATLLSTMLRCVGKALLPLYATIVAILLNTGLNYILIFGKFGFPVMGVDGAAIATVISQLANFLLILILFCRYTKKEKKSLYHSIRKQRFNMSQYLSMLLPILVTELFWSIGENVYAAIYGRMGTKDCAAMTLTNPIQGLLIGALSGLAQAASIIIGKSLGKKQYEQAYKEAKQLLWYGFAGSVTLSLALVFLSKIYVGIYQVEDSVKMVGWQLLIAFAIISPVKVQNMILGGGVLRSGGKTKYVMFIDLIGTWIFGVPLGLLSAFIWNLSIPYVYFILSLEECVRFGIGLIIFKRRKWIQSLES
ncbi:Na+ driven multidrug efflux pump [Lachnospiraceae bacterium KM106-2]|nr:Na+ driven multidrug efflux pump [Lachnospiraceae bacterium KM106-2]